MTKTTTIFRFVRPPVFGDQLFLQSIPGAGVSVYSCVFPGTGIRQEMRQRVFGCTDCIPQGAVLVHVVV